MEDGTVRLELPAGSQYIRVARLVAGGIGVVAGMDVEHVDDLRIAVDELCSALVEVGDGSGLELHFGINDQTVEVAGRTAASSGMALDRERLGLSEQILAVACDEFSLDVADGIAAFHLRKRTTS
jgi:hypothetical protein